jgi:hypothetical protein
MIHLLITILALGLFISTMIAGIGYLKGDIGLAATTQMTAISSYLSIEEAAGAYRIANAGAIAQSIDDLTPYLAMSPPPAPKSMSWTYATDASGSYACLSGPKVGPAEQRGLVKTAAQTTNAVLAKTCGATAADEAYDGAAALTFRITSGN